MSIFTVALSLYTFVQKCTGQLIHDMQGARGGACAATALVKDGELYVANVGDCRAVLCSRGGAATALTSDHTPGRQDERLRIESSVRDQYTYVGSQKPLSFAEIQEQ